MRHIPKVAMRALAQFWGMEQQGGRYGAQLSRRAVGALGGHHVFVKGIPKDCSHGSESRTKHRIGTAGTMMTHCCVPSRQKLRVNIVDRPPALEAGGFLPRVI